MKARDFHLEGDCKQMVSHIDTAELVSELQDGVFVCTKEGDILYANPALARIFRVGDAEILTKNFVRDFVERNLDWMALVSLLEQGSTMSDYEIKFRRDDGVVFCSGLSVSLLKKSDGSVLGIAGTMRDISTRKSVENELKEKALKIDGINRIAKVVAGCRELRNKGLVSIRDELRRLVDFDQIALSLLVEKGSFVEVIAPDSLSSNDSKSRGIVPISGSMLEELKFRKDAVVIEKGVALRTYSEFLVLDVSTMSSTISVPLRSGQRVLGALTVFAKEPSRFTWDTADVLQLVADQISNLVESLNFMAALEARTRLHMTLVDTGVEIQKAISSEQVFATIAHNIGEVVPYTDLSFYLVDWSKNLIIPVYAVGSWADEIMANPGTTDEGVVGAIAISGKPELVEDIDDDPRAEQIPGTPVEHTSMLGIPLIGNEGVIGVLELYRPMGHMFTPADLEAGQMFAQQASVALENFKLVSRLQDIKKEIEMLNDLMFHDINNFNFASLNYIEMVARNKELSADQKMHLEKALSLIRQTAALIDNVKKLTKIGGMNTKDFTTINLADVLKKAVSGLENSFPGVSLSVNLQIPDEAPVVANALVEELFVNLLSNAVKYDPHEEVEIDVECVKVVEAGKPSWRVCIMDNGQGVPDEKKPLLFEKFVRLRPDSKTPGTGLGLSICRALVDKFGGRIWVEDRVHGKSELGAKFCVMLPAARESPR